MRWPPLPVSEQALNAQIQQLEGRRSASGNAQPGGAATVVKVNQGAQGIADQQPAPPPAPTNARPQLPNTGTATYNGSFNVTQSQNGPFAGSVNMGWNFASQSGSVTMTADGRNPNATGTTSGAVKRSPGTPNLSGHLNNPNLGSSTIAVDGNFVATPTSSVGGVAGTIIGRTGQDIVGQGTFSATK